MKNICLIIFLQALLLTSAHAGWASGFEKGSAAAARGIEAKYRQQELIREWREMRVRYGTPEMDRFEVLDKKTDLIFDQIKKDILNNR